MIASLGCFGLKLLGYVLPVRWLEDRRVQHVSGLVPAGLLSTLILLGTFASGSSLTLDARAAGLAAAVAAQLARAPFLAVVGAGIAVTALVRAAG
ncbi:MAG: AzlD domain-containing protein [Dehalococcoidia bacterium]